MPPEPDKDRLAFESAIRAFEAEIANAGAHLSIDGAARHAYHQQIQALSRTLHAEATAGRITWAQAAREANHARNAVMEIIRGRSTPLGLAIAQRYKREGRTLNELIAKYTVKRFGPGADFHRLGAARQAEVYAEIVKAAGRSDAKFTAAARVMRPAGRALLVLSVGISVYRIATAEDKGETAKHEAAVTGAGIGGGIAGGALAGLACGPGAPVCVGVGAFVGGALAAFGVDYFW